MMRAIAGVAWGVIALASACHADSPDAAAVISVVELGTLARVELRRSVRGERIVKASRHRPFRDTRFRFHDQRVLLFTRHGDELLVARKVGWEEAREDRGASLVVLLAPSTVKDEVLWLEIDSKPSISSHRKIQICAMHVPLGRRAPAEEWFPFDTFRRGWVIEFHPADRDFRAATRASAWIEDEAIVLAIQSGDTALGELVIDPVRRIAIERSGLPVHVRRNLEPVLDEAEIARGLAICRSPPPPELVPPPEEAAQQQAPTEPK